MSIHDDTSLFVISIAEAVITRVTSSAVVLSSEPSIIVNIVIVSVPLLLIMTKVVSVKLMQLIVTGQN